jgi:hypothetical protein
MNWRVIAQTFLNNISELHFQRLFGVNENSCTFLWDLIYPKSKKNIKPKHLLWTLFFLRVYPTQVEQEAIIGCDHKTFNLYVWNIIDLLYLNLEMVCINTIKYINLFLKDIFYKTTDKLVPKIYMLELRNSIMYCGYYTHSNCTAND